MEVQLCRSFYLSEVTYLSTSPQGSNLPCSWVAVSLKYLLNRFLYDTTLALISSGTLSFTVGRALLARGRLCEGPPSWVPLLKELWVDERSSVDAGRKERCTVVSVCCWFKVAWPNRLNKAFLDSWSAINCSVLFCSTSSEKEDVLVPVVQKADNTVHRINHYPLDSAISFPNTYPLDSDLKGW